MTYIIEQNKLIKKFDEMSLDYKQAYFAYALPSINIHEETNKVLNSYSNLLTEWEKESINLLNLRASGLLASINLHFNTTQNQNIDEFKEYYNDKVRTSQNEKINIYVSFIESNIKSYCEQLNITMEDFRLLL